MFVLLAALLSRPRACGYDATMALRYLTVLLLAACSSSSQQVTPDAPVSVAPLADAGGIPLSACAQKCFDDHPVGAQLFQAWFACTTTACKDASDAEQGNCIVASTIGSATAACRSQTSACFSGPAAGCKELMDLVETRCTPAHAPPYTGDDFNNIMGCILATGFTATPDVQNLAWPLFTCALPITGGGCSAECAKGAAACRACAQTMCAEKYSACSASSSGSTPDTTPPKDKADCQAAYQCFTTCP